MWSGWNSCGLQLFFLLVNKVLTNRKMTQTIGPPQSKANAIWQSALLSLVLIGRKNRRLYVKDSKFVTPGLHIVVTVTEHVCDNAPKRS